MTNVLNLSMDATLLSGATGDSLERHRAYARQAGALDVVVCVRGHFPAQLVPSDSSPDRPLRIRATSSRTRLNFLIDGNRIARQMAADRPPDVITTQDPFLTGLIGLGLKRSLHVPLIIQDHSSIFDSPVFARESRMNRALQVLGRLVVRGADAVRVVNSGEQAACIRLGIPADRIHIIPVASNVDCFVSRDQRIDWRTRLAISDSDRLALWVGRPVPVKNLPLLLTAFAQVAAQMPNARLALAGDMNGTRIPELIAELGLSAVVKLAGRVNHADLPSLYQSADVYVHSSSYEGFGAVLVEAAAAGLPLISTITDGANDIIRAGVTGIIVPHQADLLVDALLTLLNDPAQSKAMGLRAQADVLTRFDPDQLTARWIGLLQSVAVAHKERSA